MIDAQQRTCGSGKMKSNLRRVPANWLRLALQAFISNQWRSGVLRVGRSVRNSCTIALDHATFQPRSIVLKISVLPRQREDLDWLGMQGDLNSLNTPEVDSCLVV